MSRIPRRLTDCPKLRLLIERLTVEHGWKLVLGRSNHYKLCAPSGHSVAMSGSASDHRADENRYRDIRRLAKSLGIEID